MNKIISATHWYDGPIAGRCVYEDKEYEFETAQLGGWIPNETDTDAVYVPRVYSLFDENHRLVNAVFEYELDYNREELRKK